MPLRPISGAICLAAVAEPSAATASARSQSGHRHAGVRPGGSGASHADDASANLASGSSVNAVLKPVEIHAQQTR